MQSVGEGGFGSWMNFNRQTVCAGSRCGKRKRRNERRIACRVRRIEYDRKMRQLFKRNDCADVGRKTHSVVKGAYAAFGENNVFKTAVQQIFGRQQQFRHGVCKAALQQNRFFESGNFLEQSKVLHISCADLKHVHVFIKRKLGLIGDFGND